MNARVRPIICATDFHRLPHPANDNYKVNYAAPGVRIQASAIKLNRGQHARHLPCLWCGAGNQVPEDPTPKKEVSTSALIYEINL